MGKYIKNYTDKTAYQADNTRPTDSSVVSNIEGMSVIYAGKNVIVTKKACNVGDMVAIEDGEIKYIKLDTYDANLTTLRPFGVVYHRTPTQVHVLYKNDLGSYQWAAPFRAKVEGGGLGTGGTHIIKVNASEYSFTVPAGATRQQVADAILAALPTGTGWTVEAKADYVVVQRSFYTPSINTFEITNGPTVTILNTDQQARLSGLVTPYLNITRNSGFETYYAGGNYDRFLEYYSIYGTEDRNVAIGHINIIRRSAFTLDANAILFTHYNSYEDYIRDNMVRFPFSKNAIIDSDGKKNTELLAKEMYTDDDGVQKPQCPPAFYAWNLNAGGAQWWGPSTPWLFILMSKIRAVRANDPINRSRVAIGGTAIGITQYIWAVSEYSSNLAWYYNGLNGLINRTYKRNTFSALAVTAFYL